MDHVGGGALNWKVEQANQNYTAVRSLFNIQSDVKSSQRYIASTAGLLLTNRLNVGRATRIYSHQCQTKQSDREFLRARNTKNISQDATSHISLERVQLTTIRE